MLRKAWIRYLKQGCLVETLWFWMCGIIVVYVVHVSYVMLDACSVWYIGYVYMLFMKCYVQGGTDSIVRIFHMQYWVQMVLCTCWIYSVVYILYCAHDAYVVMCACGVACMLDMQFYVHRVLCTCWICSAMYIWCCVDFVHLLCTYGVVCMRCYVHLVQVG